MNASKRLLTLLMSLLVLAVLAIGAAVTLQRLLAIHTSWRSGWRLPVTTNAREFGEVVTETTS